MPDTSSAWWRSGVHADRRPFLLARNRITRAFRGWFEDQGFEEVEAAALQVSPGNEAHLHAFATQALTISGEASPLYLHTSPEFACKKLLAAGEEKIFSLGKVWRNRERGPLHHPEFTMLEWYRAGAPYQTLMDDCATLLALAAQTAETKRFDFRGMACDPFAAPERLSVAEAFQRHAGVDLLASVSADGATDRDALAAAARAAGIRVAQDDTWADIFSRIIVEKVEPRLGEGRATVLCEYPISEAALARPKDADPRVAERFELYACGVELANAFGELTDPAEQRRRFTIEMDEKARLYGERYPIDEDFLSALEHMPEASGSALGFDRLVLLATGARRIEDVVWTPVAEPRYPGIMLHDLPIGRALRRFRRLNAVKQGHLAELLAVSQATVSRWESGAQEPDEIHRQRITALIAAHADHGGDAALKRLVTTSSLPVHLVCDATHQLLAVSPVRAATWAVDAGTYLGASLWRFASPEIIAAEQRLAETGWFERPYQRISFRTGANRSNEVPIQPGVLQWETVPLADGRTGRLTTTLADA